LASDFPGIDLTCNTAKPLFVRQFRARMDKATALGNHVAFRERMKNETELMIEIEELETKIAPSGAATLGDF
jgi:hypothetical protein